MGSFDQAQQRVLLDRSAGIGTERVAAAFQEWSEIGARLSRLEGDEQARLREADLWSFQRMRLEARPSGRRKTRAGDRAARLGERGEAFCRGHERP